MALAQSGCSEQTPHLLPSLSTSPTFPTTTVSSPELCSEKSCSPEDEAFKGEIVAMIRRVWVGAEACCSSLQAVLKLLPYPLASVSLAGIRVSRVRGISPS